MSQEDLCPFCGEPIDADASFCKHCGSDAETGWKGDLDYYSLELPEDDEEEPPARRPSDREASLAQIRRVAGPSLVLSAWIIFVAYGTSCFHPPVLVLIPAAYLAACVVILLMLAPPPHTTRFQ